MSPYTMIRNEKRQILEEILNITLVFILVLSLIFEYNVIGNKIVGSFLIFSSTVLVWKSREKLALFIMFLFIFYVNYSIVVGEFFTNVVTSCPLTEAKDPINYGIAIRTILVFVTLLAVFSKGIFFRKRSWNFILTNEDFFTNDIIFYGLLFVLFYVFLTGIKEVERTFYVVAITPIYEYSRSLFLLAFIFTGNNKWKKAFVFVFMSIFVLRDIYYGGRVTSLQLIILMAVLYFPNLLNHWKVILLSVFGILGFAFVGAYRASYSFSIPLVSLINKVVLESLFVFDTATYSFYTSATHIATRLCVGGELAMESFLAFLQAFLFGTKNPEISEVTTFSSKYYTNLGGGIITTHIYFWLGWIGVFIFSALFILLVAYLQNANKKVAKVLLLSIVITSPRWYLYGPLVLIRGGIIFPLVLYLVCRYIHEVSISTKVERIFEKKILWKNKKTQEAITIQSHEK